MTETLRRTTPSETAAARRRWPQLCAMIVVFLALWTAWAWAVACYPDALGGTWVRLAVRLVLWVLPAVLYLRLVRCVPVLPALVGDGRAGRGLAYGAVAGLLPLAALAWRGISAGRWPQLPAGVDIWVNAIVAVPVAEEILCRAVIFRELAAMFGALRAAIASSLIFALIHVPYWYFSGAFSGMNVMGTLGTVFLLGLLLAALDWKCRTLLAPVALHVLNNLFSQCVV